MKQLWLSGRIKIEVLDWYGKNDVTFGTKEGRHQQFNKMDKSSLFFLRNLGTAKEPVYDKPEAVTDQFGNVLTFGSHDPSPHVYDVQGCGRTKLFVGGENGYIYVYDMQDKKPYVFEDADIKII